MRKIFLHINVSLDGFIEDQNHEMDWHFVDDEFEEYINDVLRSIDGMIFGRVAHQLLAQYWPTASSNPDASKRHLEAVRMMNSLPKYAISSGGYKTEWENSHVIDGDIAAKIEKLKSQPGKDIALFAGAGVSQTFMDQGLIDEYRIVVNPILLRGGTPLFKPGSQSDRTSVPEHKAVQVRGRRAFLLANRQSVAWRPARQVPPARRSSRRSWLRRGRDQAAPHHRNPSQLTDPRWVHHCSCRGVGANE